ncbi:hypothetical protein [Maribacter sp. IgM3_T14_3]|uniref:hypothetical protein n=1 Tax=Maribacter sp. IgM3_T14_3 TaxID=3415140 RepID=UPI003C6F232C
MNRIVTIISIINDTGDNYAFFVEREDLYSSLSGVKDIDGDNMEFVKINDKIQLNENTFILKDINLKLQPVKFKTRHIEKREESTPLDFRIEIIVTVEDFPFKV